MVSNLTVEQIQRGRQWQQYSSTLQLITDLPCTSSLKLKASFLCDVFEGLTHVLDLAPAVGFHAAMDCRCGVSKVGFLKKLLVRLRILEGRLVDARIEGLAGFRGQEFDPGAARRTASGGYAGKLDVPDVRGITEGEGALAECRVVDGVEETEETAGIVVAIEVAAIDGSRDAAHDLPVLVGGEERGLGVLKEGVLRRV